MKFPQSLLLTSLLLVSALLIAGFSGCVRLKNAVADKDHFSTDDRIVGKWSDGENNNITIRRSESDNGIYDFLADEEEESIPFRILKIDELLIVTAPSHAISVGDRVDLDSEEQPASLLCEISADGTIRLFDWDQAKVAQAVESKELEGTVVRGRLLGRVQRVKVSSEADDLRKWLKAAGRAAFETKPFMTLTGR